MDLASGRGFRRFTLVLLDSVGQLLKLLLEFFGLFDLLLDLRHEVVDLNAGDAGHAVAGQLHGPCRTAWRVP